MIRRIFLALGPGFTIKGCPDCRIIFDSVRLWKVD